MRMISPGFISQLFYCEVSYVPRYVYCDWLLLVRCGALFVLVSLEQSESIYVGQGKDIACAKFWLRSEVIGRILTVDFDGAQE